MSNILKETDMKQSLRIEITNWYVTLCCLCNVWILFDLCIVLNSFFIFEASLHEKSSDAFMEGWNFPSSSREELEYQIFMHFWEQGFFLTRGGKFGGDYLVYPGKQPLQVIFYNSKVKWYC